MRSFIPWRKLHALRILVLVLLIIIICSFGIFTFTVIYSPEWIDGLKNYYDDGFPMFKTPQSITNQHESDFINYGIVIDCGSSGSRLFVYYWKQHSGEPDQLLDIQILKDYNNKTVISKIEPGLSSYSKTPSQASDYIAPLLKFAEDHIPSHKIKETPLYILATAGMRLLPKNEQTAILNDLRTDIGLDFDFLFASTHIEVISGKWEGIFAWTALNHALGKFNHKLSDDSLVAVDVGNKVHIRKRTVGMLDLGGASLQMTFELPQTHSFIDSKIKDHVIEFNLGCSSSDSSHIYKIYSRTFLGHGSNEKRLRYSEWLTDQFKFNSSIDLKGNGSRADRMTTMGPSNMWSSTTTSTILSSNSTSNATLNSLSAISSSTTTTLSETTFNIVDPCLSLSYNETVTRNGTNYNLIGTGDLLQCIQFVKNLLNKSKDCFLLNRRRCALDGVVLPDINYGITEFYGFSEFYYTMQDILEIGGSYSYHHYVEHAKKYCSTAWSIVEEWRKTSKHPRADAQRYRLQCFKSAWMLALMHDGLNLPLMYRHFTSIQYIDDYEVHWSLGALLHKTKYFPLRDIEKASQKHLKTSTKTNFPMENAIIFISLLFILTIASYCCSKYFWPSKSKRQVTMSINTVDDDDYIVDLKSDNYKMKMIRSRSYGFFANSAQNVV